MIGYAIAALRPQVRQLLISANRNIDRYQTFGFPVLEDALHDFQGPLAGVASALQHCKTELLATAPCDSPFLLPDLVQRLEAALLRDNVEVAIASDGLHLQPGFALMRRHLLPELQAYLASGQRKTADWYTSLRHVRVDFSDCPDSFMNINTAEQLRTAATWLRA
jgi:molybdenum cofactor guanylyltransferase